MLCLLLLSLTPFGAFAQSSGTFTLSTSSGCIVLSQVATLTSPYSITQSRPICPGGGATINWPLTSGGNGAASSLAIYAGFQGSAPGCMMPLSQMQAMYILGRMLEWRADGIWDSTANGLLRDPTSFEVLTW
ncbi:hypothetical protein DB88DRAFT_480097 [Papiliotrema laurentii]|uniref:Uncharacterized protein n=1 Tax=Papiliotrema laurentii TaxID=5418 RepID=A0AAD9FXG2_PAPLA|nr:hypothetical protein DB88DRAFT_480097 [Papiliotrema laurentii]